jgi:UDP-N-acetyl-D-glucosamine dehydrogenase
LPITPLQRISDRSAVVGIIGLGYVGLPLARAFHDAGFGVLGFDIDPEKIDALAAGRSYIRHLGDDFTRQMASSGRFSASNDFSRLGEPDALLICVPTPLGKHLEPDLSYVERTADDISQTLRPGQLVVLESTTYPRTTREIVLPRLLAGPRALKCGSDDGFYLAFSPEREDPGRIGHSTRTIPKLVGGIDAPSGHIAESLYRGAISEVVRVGSAEVAEAAKLLENIYRSSTSRW